MDHREKLAGHGHQIPYLSLYSAMSSIQHLVSPELPTILENHAHVDLPGYDLIMYVVLPMIVSLLMSGSRALCSSRSSRARCAKFKEVSGLLQLYTHTAGQLRCLYGRWLVSQSVRTS